MVKNCNQKDKVDRLENMMQFIIEIYTDLFSTPREKYLEDMKSTEPGSEFLYFFDFDELRQSIEER